MRTQVVIVGGGPAGSLLSHLLAREGVDSVVLEHRSRAYVLGRVRAGILEAASVTVLREAGLGRRMDAESDVHEGVEIAFGGGRVRIDFQRLVGRNVTVWGQTELQKDLYDALDDRPGALLDEVDDVRLDGLEGDAPSVAFTRRGERTTIDCDWIAGCDGSHGVTRAAVPAGVRASYERTYPFGWLGVLSETPPVNAELIYASSERGFALCSMRNEALSRYYVQCPLEDRVEDWPDDRFWDELTRRLPDEVGARLVTGPSVEKSIAPLRSFVGEPMRHGRLLLAGDAAHVMPPTGAKGLNLAIADVAYLAQALVDACRTGAGAGVDTYSDVALRRVWRAARFSWWLTTLLHRFPDDDGGFHRKLQLAELDLLASSEAARAAHADSYTGLPL